MSKLDEVKDIEREWADEYEKYTQSAHEIDEETAKISNEIKNYVSNINAQRKKLEGKIWKIHSFLNLVGYPSAPPHWKDFVIENVGAFMPCAYLSTSNPKEYMYDDAGGLKKAGRALWHTWVIGGAGKYSRHHLKLLIKERTISYENEQTAWERDKLCREGTRDLYNLKLEITKLYYNVFCQIEEAIETIIMSEIPGIRAFLYAQGVKDAIFSGMSPSQSRPAPIQRFLQSPMYAKHVTFTRNAHDFYTLLVSYYENGYLTRLLEGNTAEIEAEDKQERLEKEKDLLNGNEHVLKSDEYKVAQKVKALEQNIVFGGKHG